MREQQAQLEEAFIERKIAEERGKERFVLEEEYENKIREQVCEQKQDFIAAEQSARLRYFSQESVSLSDYFSARLQQLQTSQVLQKSLSQQLQEPKTPPKHTIEPEFIFPLPMESYELRQQLVQSTTADKLGQQIEQAAINEESREQSEQTEAEDQASRQSARLAASGKLSQQIEQAAIDEELREQLVQETVDDKSLLQMEQAATEEICDQQTEQLADDKHTRAQTLDVSRLERALAQNQSTIKVFKDSQQISRGRAQWLSTGRQNAKQQATALQRLSSKPQTTADMEELRLDQIEDASVQPNKGSPAGTEIAAKTLPSKNQEVKGSLIAKNLPAVFGKAGDAREDKEESLRETSEKTTKEGKEPSVGDGTQAAPSREPNTMSAYFATNYDAQNDRNRSWQRQSYDEQAEEILAANGLARNRQGAIVEQQSAEQYNNVALEETLMPRLQELIQRLSSMGYSWARVVVPLDAQTKMIVRFNMQNGRVKLHLSAPSQGLCDMIASGWDALKSLIGQHRITLEDPTFDTNTQTND